MISSGTAALDVPCDGGHVNRLNIAAQQLSLLKGIHALEVKVIAARIHFAQRRVTGTKTAVIYIDPHPHSLPQYFTRD